MGEALAFVPTGCDCDAIDGDHGQRCAIYLPGMDDTTERDLARAAKHVTTWTEKRNALIRQALANGAGVREVARATGLAPATVLNIQKPKQRGTP